MRPCFAAKSLDPIVRSLGKRASRTMRAVHFPKPSKTPSAIALPEQRDGTRHSAAYPDRVQRTWIAAYRCRDIIARLGGGLETRGDNTYEGVGK